MQSFFRSSQAWERGFCPVCSSTISARYLRQPNLIFIAAESLDDINVLSPLNHAFVERKAQWISIEDGLPRFPGPLSDIEAESKI